VTDFDRAPGTDADPLDRLLGAVFDEIGKTRDQRAPAAGTPSRYELRAELSRQSESVVIRARDLEVDREVALRILDDAEVGAVRRFLEEAQVGAQLQHPGILPVYGLGLLEDGRAFVASKLVEGTTLAEFIEREENPEHILSALEQAAQAVAYAHARGVAHGTLDASRIHAGAHGEVLVSGWDRAVRTNGDEKLVRKDVRALATLTEKALGKRINGNLQSAGMIARAIGKHLANREARIRESEIAAAEARVQAQRERIRFLRSERETKRQRRARRRTIAAAVAAILLVLLGLGASAWRRAEERTDRGRIAAQTAHALREAGRHEAAGDWARARAWAGKACALAGGEDKEARAFLARVERRARLAAEDAALQARLDEIRADSLFVEDERIAADYQAAFREHGLDLLAMDRETAVAALRGRTDPAALAAAVFTWGVHSNERARHLREIARLADPHPWRSTFRGLPSDEELHRLTVTADLAALSPRTLTALAEMLDFRGEIERAIEVVREAGRRHPGDSRIAIMGWHLILIQSSASEEAAAHLGALLAGRPTNKRLWLDLGFCLWSLGRAGGGLEATRRSVELDGAYFKAHQNLSISLAGAGRIREAIEHARRAVELEPDSWRTHYSLGALLCDNGIDQAEAVREFREAIRLRPDVAGAHLCLGFALNELGDREGALAAFARAVRLAPGCVEGFRAKGYLHLARGEDEMAADAFRTGLDAPAHLPQEFPGDTGRARLRGDLCRTLFQLGRYEECVSILRERIEETRPGDPQLYDLYSSLSTALIYAGRLGEAVETAGAAVRQRPRSAVAWVLYSGTLARAGRTEEGAAACRKAIEIDPELMDAHYNLGQILFSAGRPEEAVGPLRRAADLEPSVEIRVPGFEVTGMSRRDLEGTLRRLKRCHAHDLLGKAYEATGRLEEALRQYRQAQGLDPAREPVILNAIAWILATAPDPELRDPEEAVRTAERAVLLAPDNVYLRNTLGVSYYRAGRYEDAVRELRTSRRFQGEQYLAHDGLFLAMACFRLGREGEAEEWYERSVGWMEANPSEDEELERFRAEAEKLLGERRR
jgi:tetratricopeptide (TPR) repeat protein